MLTRLKVEGFKNLVEADVSFGPVTCIAGANGVGKSNLFDAIHFLSALTEMPLMEAALSVRSEGGRSSDVRGIFHRLGDFQADEMRFEAEMLVPRLGVDDLGQEAAAKITFLRYILALKLESGRLSIQREELTPFTPGEARLHLGFPHSRSWRQSVAGTGRRTSAFISTDDESDTVYVRLHQNGGSEHVGGGRPRSHVAAKLPRTVLSSANAAESPTAVLARREMQSWRLLQLEPSALRAPDPYTAPTSITTNGAHLPATLARLARRHLLPQEEREMEPDDSTREHTAAVFARVANRLSELIDDVRSVRIDLDDRRELLTLLLTDQGGTEHEARALSDGTLRFLALAILENDPTTEGVLCLEEPENGIHPERIPAMLRLLRDLAVDTEEPAGPGNPLRQVIVNTHSPAVVNQVLDDELLLAIPEPIDVRGRRGFQPSFRWLSETWRAVAQSDVAPLSRGVVLSYLNPLESEERFAEELPAPAQQAGHKARRVMDRPDLQLTLDFEPCPLP